LQNIPFARADLLRATAQASKGTNNKYFILKEIKTCHVIKAKGTVVRDLKMKSKRSGKINNNNESFLQISAIIACTIAYSQEVTKRCRLSWLANSALIY
jgi:hypothetical protein